MTSVSTNFAQLNATIRNQFPYIEEINPFTDHTNFADKSLQRAIMMDRYALKDFGLTTLQVGDLVVVTVKDDKKYPQRGYGNVTKIEDHYITVKLDDAFNGGEEIRRNRNMVDKPLEIYLEQIARRVARGVSEAEHAGAITEWKNEFTRAITELDLVPAGRIWFGAGNIAKVTWLNCFVIPSPRDSRRGIAEHAADHMDIMATGGGVGSNMSTLRPINSRVNSVNGNSSGAVSWTDYISRLTRLIQQGGSRRGAQMKALNDTHPEVILWAMCKIQNPDRLRAIAKRYEQYPEIADVALSLIDPKDPTRVVDPDFLTGANISICASHDFMRAVKEGRDWTFKFPDVQNYTEEEKKIYDEEWHLTGGDVRVWEAKGFKLKEYGTLPARTLYDLFMYCAWASAEPGFLFYDNAQDMSNCYYYAPIICTNPCGEQWLPAWATCNLSAVNLANMYDPVADDVDWVRLRVAVRSGVRFLDNVLDTTNYPLPQIEEMCKAERRIGLGYLGLADLFIKLRLRYGSPEMCEKLEEVMKFFCHESYIASSDIAAEKGSFPLFDCEKYLNSGFTKKLPEEIKELIRKQGMRNVCVNTVAPTGTSGSMIGTSTGLEPYFAFDYYRSGRMGEFVRVIADIAVDWLEEHGYHVTPDNVDEMLAHLPPYFASAQDISVEDHANVQAVVQKYIDSATSKTCNAPNSMTVADTAALYMMGYDKGLKGVTIYRDGSRFEAVLTTKAEITKDTNTGEDGHGPTGEEIMLTEEFGDMNQAAAAREFDETVVESTRACKIEIIDGRVVSSCGTE